MTLVPTPAQPQVAQSLGVEALSLKLWVSVSPVPSFPPRVLEKIYENYHLFL